MPALHGNTPLVQARTPPAGSAPPADILRRSDPIPAPPNCQGAAGTSTGINIAPGSDDDGWTVPPPIQLSDGTFIQLYKDGEALHAAHAAILSARRRVCLEIYIFADDQAGHSFAEALCRKAREGVSVYVIYDSFGTRGLGGREPEMFHDLRHSGVHLQQFHPMRPWECQFSWRPINRDHRKLLLVDDSIAGLGGLNVGAEYAGSWIARAPASGVAGGIATAVSSAVKAGVAGVNAALGNPPSKSDAAAAGAPGCDYWRDNAVGIRGPGAAPFMRSFARTWDYVTHGGRSRRAEYQHNLHDGELGVLASVPTMNSPLRPMLCDLMRSARRSLLMTAAYFVPDDPLVDELCRAARRGVRVRLMLPGRCDVPMVRLAARSFYGRLLACGVEIYERQAVVLHAKTIVVDSHSTVIGSANLDSRSIEYNLEISAIIRNSAFGQQMHDLFENDVRYARRISPADWRKLPRWDRLAQWTVSRARYAM